MICPVCDKEFYKKRATYCCRSCYLKSDARKESRIKSSKKSYKEKNKLDLLTGRYAYVALKKRCNNKKFKQYQNYGGKGIKCKITLEEFRYIYFRTLNCEICDCVLDDINRNSKNGRTIDRIDSNYHYIKENLKIICRSCNSSRRKS